MSHLVMVCRAFQMRKVTFCDSLEQVSDAEIAEVMAEALLEPNAEVLLARHVLMLTGC